MALSSIFRYAKSRSENIFMLFLVGSVASELMWVIRMRNERDVTATNTSTQLKVMDRVINKLNAGEKVDLKQELLLKDTNSDYEDILKSIQELDMSWRQETTKEQVSLSDLRAPSSNTSKFL